GMAMRGARGRGGHGPPRRPPRVKERTAGRTDPHHRHTGRGRVTEQAIEVDLGGVLGSWETTAPRDPELPSSFAMRQEWLQDLGGLGSEEAVMTYWILCRADWPRAQTSWFEGLS